MEKFILDTNLFFNMQADMGFGNKTEEVIRNLTQTIKSLNGKAEFYMPPRLVEEMLSFFEDKEQPFLKEFQSVIIIKSPDLNNLQVSAALFAQFIEETRNRAYRGMNVAEEEIQKAGEMFMGKEMLGKKEFQMTVGSITKNFRERFRTATRVGFIDSLGDFDLIMLAKETNGYVVSTDEGVLRWGRILGVKEMPSSAFGIKLNEMK